MINTNEIMETLREFQVRPSKVRVEVNDVTAKVIFSKSELIQKRTAENKLCYINEKKRHKKHGKVKTPITLQNIKFQDPLTEFDRAVHNICMAEGDAGNQYTTPSIIFRALVGKVGEVGISPTPQMKAKIEESIDKLMCTTFSADVSESYKILKYTNGDELKIIKSTLLPCCRVQAKINGQVVDAVFFDRESPLFAIANLKNQIVRYDASLLDVPNMKSTVTNISLINYVMRRVVEIKAHRQLAPTITFDDVYKKCGLENASRKAKFDARETVVRLFKNLIDKKFINSFEVVSGKSCNKVYAISFNFTPSVEFKNTPAQNNDAPAANNSPTSNDSVEKKSEENLKKRRKSSYSDSVTSYSDSVTSYSDSVTSYSDSVTPVHKKSGSLARYNRQSSNRAKNA